ncbi:hypothetical protein ACIHCQ_20730 [Streptomyces sp. NPDC052236]|uniref:hypothetical protein n=1 Tax=Streptomyces sp. NPDC052236 TaxID=3365686 RepID=UPI0037D57F4D
MSRRPQSESQLSVADYAVLFNLTDAPVGCGAFVITAPAGQEVSGSDRLGATE